ncbi:hypothetical protein ABZ297_30225 [Nonomuraea sp. NPDC005983]|uniref:hypothetical protein n=1 Tax=Nonomuraea sp. NPDC005983 TaxID=3155595 RepID=UPI0033A7A4B1
MYVIYRSWDEGPLGKSVRHLPEPTVLDWVRRAWDEAPSGAGAYDWLAQEVGANVYGLGNLFEGGGPAPRSMAELRTLARRRLSDTVQCNVDEHSVRVLANGLDHEVAYYLVDDAAVAAEPGRWSFALHDGPLPDAPDRLAGGPAFVPPVAPTTSTPRSLPGEGATYAVILACMARHESVGWARPWAFPGVRLPRLGAALSEIDATAEGWPLELLVLRALVAPGESGIAAALERCGGWPRYVYPPAEVLDHLRSHAAALNLVDSVRSAQSRGREGTSIRVGEHVAQMSIIAGYSSCAQWFFFDDVWAAAHRDLAASLIWYGYHWDPLCASPHFFLTPCSDNRVLYLAVAGEGGRVEVRVAEPEDEPRVRDFRDTRVRTRPAGSEGAGDVVGRVEIRLHDREPDGFTFGAFQISQARGGQDVAAALARRIREDLRDAGITHATGWLPGAYTDGKVHPHGNAFLRVLGPLKLTADGTTLLIR